MLEAIRSKVVWAVGLALAASLIYSILYFQVYGRLDEGDIVAVATRVLGFILNFLLIFRIAALEEGRLGDLSGDKVTLIIGMLFAIIAAVELFEKFHTLSAQTSPR